MNESYEVVKERNDKNKAFHKTLKTYYIGIIEESRVLVWTTSIFDSSFL